MPNITDHPDSYQRKQAFVVQGCISAYSTGNVYMYEGTIDAEVNINILETYVMIKAKSLPEMAVIISTGQCKTFFCMTYNSMTS